MRNRKSVTVTLQKQVGCDVMDSEATWPFVMAGGAEGLGEGKVEKLTQLTAMRFWGAGAVALK